jgi:hypothetical protein
MRGKMKISNILITLLTLFLILAIPFACRGEKGVIKIKPKKEEAAKVKSTSEDKVSLTIGASSGNMFSIDLTNGVPVRGLQFTIEGVKITEIQTTARAAGFITKFNEKNGAVILVSSSGDSIAPGKGPVAEVVCDKPGSATLSGVKIAGNQRQQLKTD